MEKPSDFYDKRPLYTASFARSSKAISVLWGVFTICFAIIVVVIFIQPQWIGETHMSKSVGHFGLWQRCRPAEVGLDRVPCVGDLKNLDTIPVMAFKAATILVGSSVVATLLCVCCLLLFFVVAPSTVFTVAGFLQLIAALSLLMGVCVYPLGFSAPEVVKVCGHTARAYHLGECEVRWAYLLAILGVFDTVGLSALAFLLGSRSKKLKQHIVIQQQSQEPLYAGSIYKGGHLNPEFVGDAMSIAASRKSLNLQPVMMLPRPDLDTYSEFSHPRSKGQAPYRGLYALPAPTFQL